MEALRELLHLCISDDGYHQFCNIKKETKTGMDVLGWRMRELRNHHIVYSLKNPRHTLKSVLSIATGDMER